MSSAAATASAAVASAATVATSAAPAAPTVTTTTTAAATAASTTIATSVSARWTIASAGRRVAIEIRLVFVREVAAALNHHGAGRCRGGFADRCGRCGRAASLDSSASAAAHLRALLFQNRLARQPDAVAFYRQHLDQHLVAFFQFIAHIGNAMLRHFADVQQAFGSRNDLNERAEIRQPRDFPEIGLPYFRSRRQVANNLQRLRRRRLIARGHLYQT